MTMVSMRDRSAAVAGCSPISSITQIPTAVAHRRDHKSVGKLLPPLVGPIKPAEDSRLCKALSRSSAPANAKRADARPAGSHRFGFAHQMFPWWRAWKSLGSWWSKMRHTAARRPTGATEGQDPRSGTPIKTPLKRRCRTLPSTLPCKTTGDALTVPAPCPSQRWQLRRRQYPFRSNQRSPASRAKTSCESVQRLIQDEAPNA